MFIASESAVGDGGAHCVVPFMACGDLSQYDSDTTYPVEVSCYNYLYHYMYCCEI